MDRRERRSHLRMLDSYLEALESLQASGDQSVPASLLGRLQRDVPGVRAGLSVSDTLELVFLAQERHLSVNDREDAGVEEEAGLRLPLPERQARLLTETIKKQLRANVSLLLCTAHNCRAWAALGYSSWEEYVRQEFGLSRRRSYELLDHAQVMLTIRDAGHMRGIPHLRPYTASRLKPHLEEICRVLAAKTSKLEPAAVEQVVGSLIEEWRARFASERIAKSRTQPATIVLGLEECTTGGGSLSARDSARLGEAILFLASLPPLDADAARRLDLAESVRATALPAAASWLTKLRCALVETSKPPSSASL